ncbi:hypothetical protein GCM10007162_09320 [Ignatzschineria ureiclastica]|nr:hypothetical protein GCM10007162_09320 [Ignatzschineria ureiclastica]
MHWNHLKKVDEIINKQLGSFINYNLFKERSCPLRSFYYSKLGVRKMIFKSAIVGLKRTSNLTHQHLQDAEENSFLISYNRCAGI